jgi:ABC-type multidrug transport system ATPase subunit
MSEPLLKALMQLFALIIDINEDKFISESEKTIVKSFLSRQLNSELVEKYLKIFTDYLDLYHRDIVQRDSLKDKKRTTLTSMRILGICEAINEELEQKQKIYVIIQLIEFISYSEWITEKELEFLETVASAFNIQGTEYQNIRYFIINPVQDIPEKTKILLLDSKETCKYKDVKHTHINNLSGEILFLNIESINSYILQYKGKDDFYLNGQYILPGLIYTFDHGSSIRNSAIKTVYYSDVAGRFSVAEFESRISLKAENILFRFRNSNNGIQDFNFHEESGTLIGIIGGSGVGKSTLLNVLNGKLRPQRGNVLINGYDIYDEKEKSELEGAIGFVPQDDLLIEELNVYQNLYYNARLCLDNFPDIKLREVVNKVLDDLNLYDIKDLKVGNPLKKIISGGQRKRVNIALELIREPSILFVDEPTSGLSSVDSEAVMNLLKEQTYHGKLVIVNIHQPSSDLYKMFDKIVILDKGGYLVFYGNPMEAVVYFKTQSHHANANEDYCIRCGNANPDQVLQIIEAKVVNEHGKQTRIRKVSPSEWHELFKKNTDPKQKIKLNKEELPDNYYSIPGLFKQLKIFFTRDLLSKLSNKQFILISLLEAPLLAIILGFFTKYISGIENYPGKYVFSNNENLPAFLFLSVVVSLFLGLVISSEEIIKDRKILQRESFLNLSRFSYVNSKILIMFLLSAIQTISYVLVSNLILEIKGMTLSYWLVLFTTSCFANMLGLNISSGFNSVITIYILIPFLLIPQLLFGGVIVKFDKLHKSLTSYEYVPLIGDLMASRWAYEALSVEQFKNNEYERNFFSIEQEISNSDFYASFLIPDLQKKLTLLEINIHTKNNEEQTIQYFDLFKDQIQLLNLSVPSIQFNSLDKLNIKSFSELVAREFKNYLGELDTYFNRKKTKAMTERDNKYKELVVQFGGKEAGKEVLIRLKEDYHNASLADLVLNRKEINKIVEKNNRLIRKSTPIYMNPTSVTGRAHFYAPVKKIGNQSFDTLWFNIVVIWVISFILYLTLYYDMIKKAVTLVENIRLRQPDNE